jgi:Flp pilus assembly protein TadD
MRRKRRALGSGDRLTSSGVGGRFAVYEAAQAERDFRRALELNPNHTASLSDLAVLLTIQNRLPEARTLLEKLVALRPDDQVAAANLARVRQMGG